jgi:hypothetical protein
VNDLYEVALRDTPEGVRLFWQIQEGQQKWRESREGAYLLRTNLQAASAEELWSKYMQLTEAEASFRALKSELSIRPLFHQKEPRIKAPRDGGIPRIRALEAPTQRRAPIEPKPAVSGVDNVHPLSSMKALALLSTPQVRTLCFPQRTGARSGCGTSPSPTPSRNRCFSNPG